MPTISELREKRNSLATELHTTVGGEWDATTEDKFNRLDSELRKVDAHIDAMKRAEQLEATVIASAGVPVDTAPTLTDVRSTRVPTFSAEVQREGVRAYLRGTWQNASPEVRAYVNHQMNEERAQSVGTNSAGGFLLSGEFATQLEDARKFYGAMMGVATNYRTATGATLTLPTVDDTGNAGAIIAENAQVSEGAMTFAQTTINSYTYTSNLVLVSYELMQDSEFPLDAFIANKLGERLGRINNTHWTVGTGSSQPHGVVVGATLGKTGANGQTTTVVYADLIDLLHSVDPIYRTNARWMMNDASVAKVRKLVDGQSRPLWEPSLQIDKPDTLLGYPVVINQDVASMAASAKSILFGDFSKYIIRDVAGISVVRLQERYADYRQVGFYAFLRTGGRLLDAGTNPVKYYANSAT